MAKRSWKQQQPKPLTKFGPLGAFDPELFAQTIQGLGLTFRWSRALECPCRMENSDQWKPDCSLCGGDGWWYVSPESDRDRHLDRDYVEVQCTFGQATIRDDIDQTFGGFSFTEALMTMQTPMRVAFRDRFVATQQEMAWNELLVSSGPGTTIEIGKTTRATPDQTRAMRYEPVKVNLVATATGSTPRITTRGKTTRCWSRQATTHYGCSGSQRAAQLRACSIRSTTRAALFGLWRTPRMASKHCLAPSQAAKGPLSRATFRRRSRSS